MMHEGETITGLYNCKTCRTASRYTYVVKTSLDQWRRPYVTGYWREVDGRKLDSSLDANCPQCGHSRKFARIEGYHNATVPCDSRCLNARGPDCECQCAGANHGQSWD